MVGFKPNRKPAFRGAGISDLILDALSGAPFQYEWSAPRMQYPRSPPVAVFHFFHFRKANAITRFSGLFAVPAKQNSNAALVQM